VIRLAQRADLPALTVLCLASKAHWGYDAAFIAAVTDELTMTEAQLGPGLTLWDEDGTALAMVQVSVNGDEAHLEHLFVAPDAMRRGLGRRMFRWALAQARAQGARRMSIDSDPFAEGFYRAVGAVLVGEAPSGSIPGRMLPLLSYDIAHPATPPT
jgi:GNAT superfamily N-acetyltransferase